MLRMEEPDDAGRTNNTSHETNRAASMTTNMPASKEDGRKE
jgi:hypothetical protein